MEAAGVRIGFLGAGKMATALTRGWLTARIVTPDRVRASDPSLEARNAFLAETGITAFNDNAALLANSDLVILAVKPQSMTALANKLKPHLEPRHLLISIAAGVTLRQLQTHFGESTRIVRVMPNTPCLVGASASGFTPGPSATPADTDYVGRLFSAVGKAYCLPESLLDAVTGLSGSGPAFVFVMIEALADGGVKVGLPRDAALALAAQTVLGAARMVLETGRHPAELKDAVASPAGTTIAGLHALERAGVRAAFMDAVEAATRRASELGNGNNAH